MNPIDNPAYRETLNDAAIELGGGEAPDDFSDLEALLTEAKLEKKTGEAVKEARAKAKAGYGLSVEDLERIKRWELEREWQPVSNVALFRRYECLCGYHSTVFEGLMLEQSHRTMRDSNRWTAATTETTGLPSTSAIRKTSVLMCQRCATQHGYSLATSLVWEI